MVRRLLVSTCGFHHSRLCTPWHRHRDRRLQCVPCQSWWATHLRADDGVFMISKTLDRNRQMARDPRDLASLAKVLFRSDEHRKERLEDHAAPLDSLWCSLSIGVVDSEWGTDSASKWKWGSAQLTNLSRWRCFFSKHQPTHRSLPRDASTPRLYVAWVLRLLECPSV